MGFIRRALRLYRFRKAGSLAARGNPHAAREILEKLTRARPDIPMYKVLLGDTYLFEGKIKNAADAYALAQSALDIYHPLSDDDRMFLEAYLNFRKLAALYAAGKEEFKNWSQASNQINKMPASQILKDVFILPVPSNEP